MDSRELSAEYAARVKGTSQEETQLHWLWYLKQLWVLNRNPDIFVELQRIPRANGMINVQRHIEGRLSARELVRAIREETTDLYADCLMNIGMADIVFDREYETIANRPAYEAVKAFGPMTPEVASSGEGLGLLCDARSTMWLQFVEALHARHGLPSVLELAGLLAVSSPEEKEVILKREFDKYSLTEEEVAEVKEEISLEEAIPVVKEVTR